MDNVRRNYLQGGDDEYSTKTECADVCKKDIKYQCISGSCKESPSGTADKLTCENDCPFR